MSENNWRQRVQELPTLAMQALRSPEAVLLVRRVSKRAARIVAATQIFVPRAAVNPLRRVHASLERLAHLGE